MIFKFFQRQLATRPLRTQMVIAATISGSGDCMAQYFGGNEKWDKLRTARFAFLSGCFMAPTIFVWFRTLEKIRGGSKLVLIGKRLAIDQLCFSPVFNACILFNLRFLEHLSAEKSISRLKEDWYNIYTSSLRVWPIVQLINFCFIPLNYRVILNQVVAFFWNSYLSYRTQKPIDHIEQFY